MFSTGRSCLVAALILLSASIASAEIVTYKIHYTITESFQLPYNFMAVRLIRAAGKPDGQEFTQNRNDWRDFTVGEHTITVTTESIGVPDQVSIHLAYYQHLFVIGPLTVDCPSGQKVCFNQRLFLTGRNDNGLTAKTSTPPIIIKDGKLPTTPPGSDHDDWEHLVLVYDNSESDEQTGLRQKIESTVKADAEFLDRSVGRWKPVKLTQEGRLPGKTTALHTAFDQLRKSKPHTRSVEIDYDLPKGTVLIVQHIGRTRWKCEYSSIDNSPVLVRVRDGSFETAERKDILIPTRDSEGKVIPVPWQSINWLFPVMTYNGNEHLIKQFTDRKAEWVKKGWVAL